MIGIAFLPSLYYTLEQWVPHFTQAYQEITPANLECIMQRLAFQPLGLEILIDNLNLVVRDEDQLPRTFKYGFGL